MVPLPSADHADIIDLLLEIFRAEIRSKFNLPLKVSDKVGVYIGKSSVTGRDYSRNPDICLMQSEAWLSLKANKTAVLRTPPILVVEVVSTNRADDYVDKVDEYQRIGITEYWIVDGRESKISVLLLNDGCYNVTEFRGSDASGNPSRERIISATLPEIALSAEQILSA